MKTIFLFAALNYIKTEQKISCVKFSYCLFFPVVFLFLPRSQFTSDLSTQSVCVCVTHPHHFMYRKVFVWMLKLCVFFSLNMYVWVSLQCFFSYIISFSMSCLSLLLLHLAMNIERLKPDHPLKFWSQYSECNFTVANIIIYFGGFAASVPHFSVASNCVHAWWDALTNNQHAQSIFRMIHNDTDAHPYEYVNVASNRICRQMHGHRISIQMAVHQCAYVHAAWDFPLIEHIFHRTGKQSGYSN